MSTGAEARRSGASSRRLAPAALAVVGVAAVGCALLFGPSGSAAGDLPDVVVERVAIPMTNLVRHTGITVTAECLSGTLVGGGSYLRNATNPATLPSSGLVLGGTSPSTGSSPVDTPVEDGAVDPSTWMTVANFASQAETGNQAATFALCATAGPQHTVVETASTTGANATQQVNPPTVTTASCAPGSRLIGGGALTGTPDQVNDGVTAGNNGNLKPIASYPSNAAGVAAADGSTGATSWSAYGSSGGATAVDKVTAYALCSTDVATPAVQVARVDVVGPDGQAGSSVTTASVTCPAGTRLLGGGYSVDQTVGATSGLQPQQAYHMRGSYPSTAGSPPTEVADGATDPTTWTSLLQAGGQSLPAGSHMNLHGYAMCATAPEPGAPGDFDGNGTSDVAVWRPSTGVWYVRGGLTQQWGASTDIPVPGNYDGDSDTDITVWRPSSGVWYVHGGVTQQWGASTDIPMPGDYDGDGTTDIAVWRPSTGTWYVRGGVTQQWGLSDDIPVPGDYDGDGATDIAVWRPSTGTWYVRGGVTQQWGASSDIPVPGDYDGDGDTEIAVWRPSTGVWYVLGALAQQWGASSDIPVPGDYDGDGDTDIAVWRPSTGVWYVLGGLTQQWGAPTDVPVERPSRYLVP